MSKMTKWLDDVADRWEARFGVPTPAQDVAGYAVAFVIGSLIAGALGWLP